MNTNHKIMRSPSSLGFLNFRITPTLELRYSEDGFSRNPWPSPLRTSMANRTIRYTSYLSSGLLLSFVFIRGSSSLLSREDLFGNGLDYGFQLRIETGCGSRFFRGNRS